MLYLVTEYAKNGEIFGKLSDYKNSSLVSSNSCVLKCIWKLSLLLKIEAFLCSVIQKQRLGILDSRLFTPVCPLEGPSVPKLRWFLFPLARCTLQVFLLLCLRRGSAGFINFHFPSLRLLAMLAKMMTTRT